MDTNFYDRWFFTLSGDNFFQLIPCQVAADKEEIQKIRRFDSHYRCGTQLATESRKFVHGTNQQPISN